MSKKSNRTNQKSSEDKIASFQLREAYKTARTNIAYSIIKKGCKKITFTSSIKGEGKTVTSTNIAHAMSQQVNTKVLIVECDLRMPKVHTVFNIEPTPGLTNYLVGECDVDAIIRDTVYENLRQYRVHFPTLVLLLVLLHGTCGNYL
jgi:Mrp family chromosome partitioning ATPase